MCRELQPSSPETFLHPVWHSAPQRPGSFPPRTQSKLGPNFILHAAAACSLRESWERSTYDSMFSSSISLHDAGTPLCSWLIRWFDLARRAVRRAFCAISGRNPKILAINLKQNSQRTRESTQFSYLNFRVADSRGMSKTLLACIAHAPVTHPFGRITSRPLLLLDVGVIQARSLLFPRVESSP